jgi:hypothetical protein
MNRRGADRIGPLASGGMVALWGASSLIKSIQYGNVGATNNTSTTGTATINAVDTANAVLLFNGNTTSDSTNGQIDAYQTGFITLTNSTTVTVTRGGQDGNGNITVNFCVVEFLPGVIRSVQAGTILLANAVVTNTATITAVNTAKSVLFYNNKNTNQGPLAAGTTHWSKLDLTNSTTITATRAGNTNQEVPAYLLVEFF